jgi:hypothetical protein
VSQREAAAAELKERTDQALREVAITYDQVGTGLQQYDPAIALQAASEVAFHGASDSYVQGIGTITNAVSARTSLATERVDVARAHAQSLINAAALAFATGSERRVRISPPRSLAKRPGRRDRSSGELGLASVVDRGDHLATRNRHRVQGLRDSSTPPTFGNRHAPQPAPHVGGDDLIGVTRLLLAVLHGVEAALWAAYWWLGAFRSPAEAFLHSVDSISTHGASGLILERHWRTMGAVEAVDDMLLFDIGTAYVFTVMRADWSPRTRRRHR